MVRVVRAICIQHDAQTATAPIGGPKFGYTGPVMLSVFYDTLFQTFAFVLNNPTSTALKGRVVAASGQPSPGQEVTAVVGGHTYRTFADAKGNYAFPGRFNGAVQLLAGKVARTLPKVDLGQAVDLSLQ